MLNEMPRIPTKLAIKAARVEASSSLMLRLKRVEEEPGWDVVEDPAVEFNTALLTGFVLRSDMLSGHNRRDSGHDNKKHAIAPVVDEGARDSSADDPSPVDLP